MDGDGNGWAVCRLGHRHWGVHGAAGLLLWRGHGATREVLLQHRAAWTNEGDTWGLPGGARDSHETTTQAALREAAEEAGVVSDRVRVDSDYVDDHGDWSYTTVIAELVAPFTIVPNKESVELRWVPRADVTALPLHPGFALTWPRLDW